MREVEATVVHAAEQGRGDGALRHAEARHVVLAWLGLGLGFGLGLGSGLGLGLGLGNVVLAVEEEQALAHVLPQEREGV